MSNSIILKDILNNESYELKKTINNYMQESFDKLQMLMKSKVDKFISDKLDSFYNKEFDNECEKELFDESNNKSTEKFFSFDYSTYDGCDHCTILYYKKNIIIVRNAGIEYILKHNFTIPMLFVIKYCNPRYIRNIDFSKNPEYFQKTEFHSVNSSVNSSDFEEICKKEYNDIEEKKIKLENLIEDYTNKKDYYESLEKQVVEARLEVENIKNEYNEKYNKEFTELEEEKLRLKNLIEEYTNYKKYYELIEEKNNDFEKEKEELQKEKEKITFIKQKLLIMKEETILMKSELQREKEKLLEYKKNTNDIDEYFDEMVNGLCEKELKNDKQNKTEFQRIINEAQKKPSYFRYKDKLLSLVTKEKNNYPIYNFITPFMPSIKSHNFKHFYESLQHPIRKDEWVNIIHNTVLDIENGDYELQQMLDLIIDKCYFKKK